VAYADFLGIECLDDWRGKLGQADPGGLCCVFAYAEMRLAKNEPRRLALTVNKITSFISLLSGHGPVFCRFRL
jgi:hypothetical protein